MPRHRISFTKPNEDWIKAKIEKAEMSGFTSDSKEDILAQSKARMNR